MSNQKNNFLLDFLSDYTSGKKAFNYHEIKGGMRCYEKSIGHDSSEETSEYSVNSDIFSIAVPTQEAVQEDVQEDVQESAHNDATQTNEKSTVKNRKTRNVWSKAFCEEVKTEFETFFKNELVTPRQKVHKHFFKLFGHKLNAEDKLYPANSTVANWQEKVDDNMKTWFVNTGYCSYINSTYTYLGLVENQQTNFQKYFEL